MSDKDQATVSPSHLYALVDLVSAMALSATDVTGKKAGIFSLLNAALEEDFGISVREHAVPRSLKRAVLQLVRRFGEEAVSEDDQGFLAVYGALRKHIPELAPSSPSLVDWLPLNGRPKSRFEVN